MPRLPPDQPAAVDVIADDHEPNSVGLLVGVTIGTSRNNHFDNTRERLSDGQPCAPSADPQAGHPREYFFDSDNAPMDSWDFDEIWQAHDGAWPTLRPPTE